eukprot:GHVH01011306.1.p1 GENE.GHVH01011306.1~~GHVH01011306.1.p1  ORF type:complete len:130 (-),score=3.99 GHVH01011306.1:259-648(-)
MQDHFKNLQSLQVALAPGQPMERTGTSSSMGTYLAGGKAESLPDEKLSLLVIVNFKNFFIVNFLPDNFLADVHRYLSLDRFLHHLDLRDLHVNDFLLSNVHWDHTGHFSGLPHRLDLERHSNGNLRAVR